MKATIWKYKLNSYTLENYFSKDIKEALKNTTDKGLLWGKETLIKQAKLN